MNRREFFMTTAMAAAAVGIAQSAAAAPKRNIQKSLKFGMVKGEDANGNPLSIEQRLQIAINAGFECVEPGTITDQAEVDQFKAALDKLEIKLDAIVCGAHWSSPLSDADTAVYEKTMESMRQSFKNVKDLGGDMVLLVPAVVNPGTMYRDAWTRSVERTKILAEEAEKLNITIGIENVWNKFLLSPLEAKHYIEEIGSDKVRMWFDVGNVVLFGYPQDWIRTLGPLIARVDVKDFKSETKEFVPLLEGSVDWPEVMKAFDEIGYQGIMAAEVKGGDEAYLTEIVSQRMDKFIAM
ncbi:MAG: hypothetical protein AMXMBFR84_32580 [Candidatus Hydrogenedentota bacterium]